MRTITLPTEYPVPNEQITPSCPACKSRLCRWMRLILDEQRVRAVASAQFQLVSQTFFKSPVRYRDFAKFEDKVLNVTHTEHRLSPALHEQVREKFNAHVTEDGARFEAPFRVDLLRKAA